MKGVLWLIRIILLIGVSLLVFSPLAVHGEAQAPQPVRFDYDVSELMLPSSPVYPIVTTYREARMSFAERSPGKAAVALTYANEDAAAIGHVMSARCKLERRGSGIGEWALACSPREGAFPSPSTRPSTRSLGGRSE